jgi:hypothetical protein
MTPIERSRQWRKNNRKKHRDYSNQYYREHPEQVKAKTKEWNESNPEKRQKISLKYNRSEKRRENLLKVNYSLSLAEYNSILLKQNGVCKICGIAPNEKRLYVDHDHKTGKIRGLLCTKCNFGIGLFADDIGRM